MTLRVMIADDHRIFRESLRCMLDLDPEVSVVGTVGSGQELLACAERTHPDIVCMDVRMPGLDGIEATRRLLARQPEIKVIGLSAFPDPHYVVAMLDAGARGYVTKHEAPEELHSAIACVVRDQVYFCPEVSSQLFEPPPGQAGEPPAAHHLPANSHELHALLARYRAEPSRPGDEADRLRQIVEGSSLASFVIDQDHLVTHWNKACEALTGIAARQIVGTASHWRAFYPTPRPLLADLVVDAADEPTFELNYTGKCRKSNLIAGAYEAEDFFPRLGECGTWLYFSAAPLYDAGGRRIGAVETLQDTTARHQAEASLRESEAHYRQLSITDNLTGLFNSRHFYDRLKAEIGRAIRYNHPLSLLMLDVDDFKRFNDTHGHLEGDQVLRRLSDVIRTCPRLGDTGYRLGGEEFAVLLPDTELEAARLVAERLRSTFAEYAFVPRGSRPVHSSVSIGVTRYRPYEKFSTFLRRGDAACYQAKHQGKNCVVVAREHGPNTIPRRQSMANPFVHIELHTPDLVRAKTFYSALFGWELEDLPNTDGSGSYTMIKVGNGTGGGMMSSSDSAPHWLAYVGVNNVRASTDQARQLGAEVVVDTMQIGPHGWISVLVDPTGARFALWQPAQGDHPG